jgi:hypothetical protein
MRVDKELLEDIGRQFGYSFPPALCANQKPFSTEFENVINGAMSEL